MTVMIDHGVAQDPVEPCHDTLFITHLAAPLQALHKRRLQDVFRGSPGFDPRLEEREELAVMVHEALDRLGSERS